MIANTEGRLTQTLEKIAAGAPLIPHILEAMCKPGALRENLNDALIDYLSAHPEERGIFVEPLANRIDEAVEYGVKITSDSEACSNDGSPLHGAIGAAAEVYAYFTNPNHCEELVQTIFALDVLYVDGFINTLTAVKLALAAGTNNGNGRIIMQRAETIARFYERGFPTEVFAEPIPLESHYAELMPGPGTVGYQIVQGAIACMKKIRRTVHNLARYEEQSLVGSLIDYEAADDDKEKLRSQILGTLNQFASNNGSRPGHIEWKSYLKSLIRILRGMPGWENMIREYVSNSNSPLLTPYQGKQQFKFMSD
ncbi:hypothetical protein JW930_03140 [Candidatus Woesearchaeota archaeon]|nr:hypothetical protein [Candidatus Woesearchaeota archaeon]